MIIFALSGKTTLATTVVENAASSTGCARRAKRKFPHQHSGAYSFVVEYAHLLRLGKFFEQILIKNPIVNLTHQRRRFQAIDSAVTQGIDILRNEDSSTVLYDGAIFEGLNGHITQGSLLSIFLLLLVLGNSPDDDDVMPFVILLQ
jgi:hypothetical protein